MVCAAAGTMPWANAIAGADRPEDAVASAEAVLEVASFGVGHRPGGGRQICDRPVDPTLFHASYRQGLPAPSRRRFGELVQRYERQLATVIRTYFIQID